MQSPFRTTTGYERAANRELTPAMEDYLEMICRSARTDGYARVNRLAETLNVKPSSSSKMAAHLRDLGYIDYQPYGLLRPTQKGWDTGGYLLERHETVHAFLRWLNGTDDELEQAERIEHFLDRRTVENLRRLLDRVQK